MYFINRFQYNAGSGGAGPVPPTITDIEPTIGFKFTPVTDPTPIVDPNKKDPNEPIQGGDGSKKEPVLDPNAPINKPVAPEGKIFNDKGEVVDDPNFKKVEPDPNKPVDVVDEPTDEEFWAEVNKRVGVPIDVKYPDGIDVLSAEGVAIREQAIRQQAEDIYDQRIRQNYPHAYAYFLHHMEGGSDATFFNAERGVSLPERTVVEGSADVQSTMIKNDLLAKGVDSEVADAQVAAYVKKNQLKDQSLKIYDRVSKEQADELANMERDRAESNKKVEAVISSMTTKIDKALPELGFVIPDADRKKVSDYIANNLQYNRSEGKFYVVQELNADDLKGHLEALTFQYYKGDLGKVVQKQVQTQAAQRLRKNAEKTKTNITGNNDTGKSVDTYVPLGSLGNGGK